MVKICVICGQLYYAKEEVCTKCKSRNLRLVKNMEVTCRFNDFSIIGDF